MYIDIIYLIFVSVYYGWMLGKTIWSTVPDNLDRWSLGTVFSNQSLDNIKNCMQVSMKIKTSTNQNGLLQFRQGLNISMLWGSARVIKIPKTPHWPISQPEPGRILLVRRKILNLSNMSVDPELVVKNGVEKVTSRPCVYIQVYMYMCIYIYMPLNKKFPAIISPSPSFSSLNLEITFWTHNGCHGLKLVVFGLWQCWILDSFSYHEFSCFDRMNIWYDMIWCMLWFSMMLSGSWERIVDTWLGHHQHPYLICTVPSSSL